jgi:TonB family protein
METEMSQSTYVRWSRLKAAALLLLAAAWGPNICRADIRVTEAEAKAAATAKPVPEYSATARQLKVVGKVQLEVVIGADGNVEDVKTVAGNPLLSRPCIKAVQDWKFPPFHEGGKPARATAPLTFEFR